MQQIKLNSDNLSEAVSAAQKVLAAGGLVLYPTETVYGVGVDATNPEAVSRLLQYKNRPAGRVIPVVVGSQTAAEKLVELNPTALNLYKTFLPGPVTVVSKSRGVVDPRLESELGTLGVRISSHSFLQALTASFKQPITTTAANATGTARPYSIEQALSGLSDQQKDLIYLIIDAGELPHNEPSTVIDTTQETQDLVRAGAAFSSVMPSLKSSSEAETRQIAANLMKSFLHALPEGPVIFALEGDLGAGKTQFTKGIAEVLQVKETVTSPTYTLMMEYDSQVEGQKVRLLHIDCWRLTEVKPEDLGLADYLKPNNVIVIEWVAPLLPYLSDFQAVGHHIGFTIHGETERELFISPL